MKIDKSNIKEIKELLEKIFQENGCVTTIYEAGGNSPDYDSCPCCGQGLVSNTNKPKHSMYEIKHDENCTWVLLNKLETITND